MERLWRCQKRLKGENGGSMESEDIVIEIMPSFLNSSRYIIVASYKNNTVDHGYGYAEQGILFNMFNIGISLEDSIKKETCTAIKDLKYNYNERICEKNDLLRLVEISQEHIKNCNKE